GGGHCRLDTRTLKSDVYKLPDDRVYSSLLDRKGRLWIGTWGGGLILFDRETGEVQQYTSSMQHGIPHDIAYSLYEDSSGIVWVGTHGGGVAKLVDWHNRYQYFQHNPRDPASLPPGKVTFLMKDSKGRVWCGVYNQGLHRLDPEKEGFRHYRAEKGNPLALQNDIINTVYEDPEGNIWICTNEGLFRYEEASDSFSQPFRGRKDFPIQETIYYIYKQDSKGNTWFGMYLEGAYYYSPKSGTYVHFSTNAPEHLRITDNLIRVIFEDSRGNIWIGTNNGLNIYDSSAQAIIRRFSAGTADGNSISYGNIRSIAETKEGKILIATLGGGVNIYDPQKDRFTYLTIQTGLLSNMVRAVLIQDALWYFPTQRGVSVYDPALHSFTPIQESTGLLNNEMTDAQFIDTLGTLYLGSSEGITVISTVETNVEGMPPPLVVTGITMMGEPVSFSSGDLFLLFVSVFPIERTIFR
ncbi:MAG TPA: two-component regulator propeller domain-containing protein, partial [Spirochaetales bacterium]|nr:two-component regulator propeller domain-containing protein [Spirochaetales bacterium]